MASAYGCQQVPGGGQPSASWTMVTKYQTEPTIDPFPHAKTHNGSETMAVPDGPQVPGGGQHMPEHLTIGTAKAFERNYPFPYERRHIGSATIYVCTKGNEWARTHEVLVLRSVAGTCTACDSAVTADGLALQCRQPVFCCLATDITQPGWHNWQTNHVASPSGAGLAANWQGALWVETRVP